MAYKEIESYGKTYKVRPVIEKYLDGNTAVDLICDDGSPFGTMTVNLNYEGNEILPKDQAYLDVNNIPNIELFCIVNGYILDAPIQYKQSGFCRYPLWQLNIEKLREDE